LHSNFYLSDEDFSMDAELFWRQSWLLARFELLRLFATRRGWLMMSAFVVIWFFILRFPMLKAAVKLQEPETLVMLTQLFGLAGMHQVLTWPLPEYVVYWLLSLILFPLLVLFCAADQTSSDSSRGTLRFIALRASRSAIFFGRFVGQVAAQSLLIASSLIATLLMGWWRQGHISWAVLESAAIIATNLFVVVLPFIALMAVASALAKSARLAVSLVIVGAGVLIGLMQWLGHYWPKVIVILDYLPGAQLPQLLATAGWGTLQFAWLPLLQTLVLLAVGWAVMRSKAL
jgi:hypothetical protein